MRGGGRGQGAGHCPGAQASPPAIACPGAPPSPPAVKVLFGVVYNKLLSLKVTFFHVFRPNPCIIQKKILTLRPDIEIPYLYIVHCKELMSNYTAINVEIKSITIINVRKKNI